MIILIFTYFVLCVLLVEKHILPNWIYKLSTFKTVLFSFITILILTLLTSQLWVRNIVSPAITILGALLIMHKFRRANFFSEQKK
jgi:presenilin-like A22 family membrane protease